MSVVQRLLSSEARRARASLLPFMWEADVRPMNHIQKAFLFYLPAYLFLCVAGGLVAGSPSVAQQFAPEDWILSLPVLMMLYVGASLELASMSLVVSKLRGRLRFSNLNTKGHAMLGEGLNAN